MNLGCGARHLDGFVNVDLPSNWAGKQPDLAHDVTKPLPYPDESADEVHAYHVFEHLYRFECDDVLDDWIRVLKPGGELVLELPCLDKIIHILSKSMKMGWEIPEKLTLWGLYGSPSYLSKEMTHKWCYSKAELTHMLEGRGLKVREEEPKTHIAARDMRLVGVK